MSRGMSVTMLLVVTSVSWVVKSSMMCWMSGWFGALVSSCWNHWWYMVFGGFVI